MVGKIYEYHIKEDKEEFFIEIQRQVSHIYKEVLNCEIMYFKNINDETKWMELSKYRSEDEYFNGIHKINNDPDVQKLIEHFDSCLVPEKKDIKESNYILKFKR